MTLGMLNIYRLYIYNPKTNPNALDFIPFLEAWAKRKEKKKQRGYIKWTTWILNSGLVQLKSKTEENAHILCNAEFHLLPLTLTFTITNRPFFQFPEMPPQPQVNRQDDTVALAATHSQNLRLWQFNSDWSKPRRCRNPSTPFCSWLSACHSPVSGLFCLSLNAFILIFILFNFGWIRSCNAIQLNRIETQ